MLTILLTWILVITGIGATVYITLKWLEKLSDRKAAAAQELRASKQQQAALKRLNAEQ